MKVTGGFRGGGWEGRFACGRFCGVVCLLNRIERSSLDFAKCHLEKWKSPGWQPQAILHLRIEPLIKSSACAPPTPSFSVTLDINCSKILICLPVTYLRDVWVR